VPGARPDGFTVTATVVNLNAGAVPLVGEIVSQFSGLVVVANVAGRAVPLFRRIVCELAELPWRKENVSAGGVTERVPTPGAVMLPEPPNWKEPTVLVLEEQA
jgi:hypothetical protein